MPKLTIEGITQPLKEWALDYGIPASLIELRIEAGWTDYRAVTTEMPVQHEWYKTHTRALNYRRHLAQGNKAANRFKLIKAFGKYQTIDEWSEELAVPVETLRHRLSRNDLTSEQALKAQRHGRLAA